MRRRRAHLHRVTAAESTQKENQVIFSSLYYLNTNVKQLLSLPKGLHTKKLTHRQAHPKVMRERNNVAHIPRNKRNQIATAFHIMSYGVWCANRTHNSNNNNRTDTRDCSRRKRNVPQREIERESDIGYVDGDEKERESKITRANVRQRQGGDLPTLEKRERERGRVYLMISIDCPDS